MRKPKWVAITSYYSHVPHVLRVPRTWEMRLKSMTICVTRFIHAPSDAWVVHCHALDITTHLLECKDTDSAKREALELIKSRIVAYLDDVESALK